MFIMHIVYTHKQLVILHNTITFQMLQHVVTLENVTLCHNIILLHTYVTL